MQPKVIHIRSENDLFQTLVALKSNRKKRNKLGQFFVEGVKNINAAVKSGHEIVSLIYAPGRSLSEWARGIITQSRAALHYEVSTALMAQLSDKEETSELLATVATRRFTLTDIEVHKHMLVVVLDRPSSPGNLGTIIRSCDSFGVDGLVITGHAVDVHDPQTIRSSVGTLFSQKIVKVTSHNQLESWFATVRKEFGELTIVGTSAKGDADAWDCDFRRPAILMFGNETLGLSAAVLALCDQVARIPISGEASSLNVACAASVFLYESRRQRSLKA